MKFCTKCNTMMNPLVGGNFKCDSCGFLESGKLISEEKIKQKVKRKSGVVKDTNIFASYINICRKCGFGRAEIIERPPYISDEDTLIFLKCGKCGYTIQLSRKIG